MNLSLLALFSLLACSARAQSLWRNDGKCGSKNPLPSGRPGQCDPAGDGPKQGPCCSSRGFCGNSDKHCKCNGCINYRELKEKADEAKPAKAAAPISAPLTREQEEQEEESGGPSPVPSLVVVTRAGPVEGRARAGHLQFLGIPYAAAPVGELRFQPPRPHPGWRDTRQANTEGPICPQPTNSLGLEETRQQSEDCLSLNVFTTGLDGAARPVMLWIHGGGFTSGSKSDYRATRLVEDEDVVLVAINYRLAALGFLSFGSSLAGGNLGLRDQQLAIQWTRQNIARFGGDPDRITIFGESAGGMSVHAQVLSPHNHGLLAGAVAQSGTMLLYRDFGEEHQAEHARAAAAALDCSTALDQATLSCLQAVPLDTLLDSLSVDEAEYYSNATQSWSWRPTVDSFLSNPFLPLPPLEAMKRGIFNQIPFISGTVKNEGAFIVGGMKAAGMTNEEIDTIWPAVSVKFLTDVEPSRRDRQLANIAFRYYNHPTAGAVGAARDQPLSDLLTDLMFLSPDQKTVEIMSRHHDRVFNYQLVEQTDRSVIGVIMGLGRDYTPLHGDDLSFLFDVEQFLGDKTVAESETDAAVSAAMRGYWASFARTGHPSPSSGAVTPAWLPVRPDKLRYMELAAEPGMEEQLEPERMLFWDSLLWRPAEDRIERQQIFLKATQFLLASQAENPPK